jgi:hypothetical protein
MTIPAGQSTQLEIQYQAQQRNDWGFLEDHILLVDQNKNKETIHLVANIVEDFSAYNGHFENAPAIQLSETESTITYKTPNSIATHDFYIVNTGKSELIIHKVITSDKETDITLPKYVIKPGKKVKATITYRSNHTDKTTKIIQLISNTPNQQAIHYHLHINPNT